ncbi:MAG: site-specific DNA-methyltransferase [Spirochaetales bacterium]|nr:site-specific DNA-methyltransferase [Leptospiraceae bacterium]MCP5481448.1 site-specific DNA-methyltransferase [Spirochaetales bacterium]
MAKKKATTKRLVHSLRHEKATRTNIPTAELESVMDAEDKTPIQIAYERRNRDLDPQLVWRGKDEQDWSDLVVPAPPLYIQEKVHPKVLIDDLMKHTEGRSDAPDLFADFNGFEDKEKAQAEFYQHQGNWTNRMILGDSLQVMASLAEREGLRGQVQCIYIDPPYGIKFNSNFQWSTTNRRVKDGALEEITREPEQVRAFRDTWRDGVHSYLTHLRDRLNVARDLLADTGSLFVQIGDENVHRVRCLLDELFGDENSVSTIHFRSMMPMASGQLENVFDHILWYAKAKSSLKYRDLKRLKNLGVGSEFNLVDHRPGGFRRLPKDELRRDDLPEAYPNLFKRSDLASSGYTESCTFPLGFQGKLWSTSSGKSWRTTREGVERLKKADRLFSLGSKPYYKLFLSDYPFASFENTWSDTIEFESKSYVVQTTRTVIQRCLLMATDPGDLVLDPTCGSGTTATVAEQWGRRWITIDTSRVALALARARVMGARYPYYLLADSAGGQKKEAEVSGKVSMNATHGDIRHGFVYERAPRVMLKSIANNAEIDVIWEKYQERLEPLRATLNKEAKQKWEEWEIPRDADSKWNAAAKKAHAAWWKERIARQKEIDDSIAKNAEQEFLYDKPYEDKSRVRVAGPFTVESISPHRVLTVGADEELIDPIREDPATERDFATMILDQLRTAGVQQAHKEGRIEFSSLEGWPGQYICAEGRYAEGEDGPERRAGIFVGPEFGTVPRADLSAAAREAAEAGFDVVIACAFNYDAMASDFNQLGKIPVLKARMNADLHMSDELKNTGKGNLFVIFGEPDIDIEDAGKGMKRVKLNGVDVFHPQTGEIHSSSAKEIACWFIDTDYNEESFFVRHAYFLGAPDPYKSLRTTLKAEIDEEAWASLNSDVSRPFPKPKTGRIAVKVINHLGDEVMKVFEVK